MSSEFRKRPAVPLCEMEAIPEQVIWRLTKNGRLAEARKRVVAWGDCTRPEFRLWIQHPTPAFELATRQVVSTDAELEAPARQRRQLFVAKGWTDATEQEATR